MLSQICSRGSAVRAVCFVSDRLLVLIQTACFCPSGTSAPTLFKSSEIKPSLSSRHCGLPPRGQLCLPYTVQNWNAKKCYHSQRSLIFIEPLQAGPIQRVCNCNVNGQCFKYKQISIYFYNPGFWRSASVPLFITSILISGNYLDTRPDVS